MKKTASLIDGLNQETISEDEIVGALPESLREIAKIIPLQCVLSLIEEFGGGSVFVPINHHGSVLAKCIGTKPAEELVSTYSGDRIAIPRAIKLLRLIRDRKIIKLRAQGMPVNKLSRQFDLTERAIYRIQRIYRAEAETF